MRAPLLLSFAAVLSASTAVAQDSVPEVPSVALEAPCVGKCSAQTNVSLDVDVDLEVDVRNLLEDIPSPPRRRYGRALVFMAAGIALMGTGVALASRNSELGRPPGGAMAAITMGGLSLMGGLIALTIRVLIFNHRRAERRRLLTERGLIRW